ncbi:kinase-like protein [Sanghuangporus baumii]|uniref:Kinase-like protein n=1 Tax=Sanghuangporus baumii TaxID=108892 RepID=A0A9Q5N6N3_SANBA|nr:kinase-like protein [Sanghuangporus baumii]
MEHAVDDFVQVASELKIYKRTAANIKEQLVIIAKSDSEGLTSLDELRTGLETTIQELEGFSRLLPFQSYLRQGDISNLLDYIFSACWKYTQTSNDDFLREDIESQREMYKSDQEADRINVKRLLRDSLRRSDVRQQLSKLTPDEFAALRSAISLELKSITDQGPDSQAARLYKEFLSTWTTDQRSHRKSITIQDLSGKITRISTHPVAWGAVCAVWKGELYGKIVSLQGWSPFGVMRQDFNEESVLKNAMSWASFNHPHVLPLLGIAKNIEGSRLALVSPWMKNDNVESFLLANPGADRLKLITEVASGLAYLHGRNPPYIHGILTVEGVLVNEDKQAIVAGFASAAFEKGVTGSLRWLPPEIVDRSPFALTAASDVYSFGLTAFTIMTGRIPFEGIRSPNVVIEMITKGQRPSRPKGRLIHHGLDDKAWSLITKCWAHDPETRPPIHEVLKELERLRELPALDVRDLTSRIRLGADAVTDVRACGAFGDIRIGILEDVGPVALKTLNIRGSAQPVLRHTKRFFREASIWNKLRHPNVLPFLGTADLPGLPTCFVSPWMENGNLIEYMKAHPDDSMLNIAVGVARGLAYLHAREPHPVIHGDLRSPNILISNKGEPLLCDFGLAVIVGDLAQTPVSTVLQDAGNPRWMSPELFFSESRPNAASDIWALGMVLLELMSHDMPYCGMKNAAQVVIAVNNGILPARPENDDVIHRGLSDDLWGLMRRCWEREPDGRPSSGNVLAELEMLASCEVINHLSII